MALAVGAGALAVLVRAQARWDRRPKFPDAMTWEPPPRKRAPENLEPASPEAALIMAQDERCAEFARDPDHAERGAAWSDLRDRMFPPSQQHYWVPNGALPGQDGKWWVFLGVTRTPWGYGSADAVHARKPSA